MTKYELIEGEFGNTIKWDDNGITRFIPADENNSDYQRYLRWLENPDADESGTL